MSNYFMPGALTAGSGALMGAAAGGPIGAAIGGIAGLGSSIFGTYQNEQQQGAMQNQINQNYQAIIDAINNEYNQGISGLGSTYSAGQRAAKANINASTGAQGLAGSPIATALNSQYASQAGIAASGQENMLAREKAQAITQATAAKGEQNQQVGLAGMQAANQQLNNAIGSFSGAGGSIGTLLRGNGGASMSGITENDTNPTNMYGLQGNMQMASPQINMNNAATTSGMMQGLSEISLPTTVNQLNPMGMGMFSPEASDMIYGTNTQGGVS